MKLYLIIKKTKFNIHINTSIFYKYVYYNLTLNDKF